MGVTRKNVIETNGKTKSARIFTKKRYPSYHCPNKNKKKDDDDNKSKSIKERKSSIKNLPKDTKKAKKTFKTIHTKIEDLKEKESGLSDSDVNSHAN